MVHTIVSQIRLVLFGPTSVSSITRQLQKTVKRLDEAASQHFVQSGLVRRQAVALVRKADAHADEGTHARNVAAKLNALLS